jgi:hypothetical protein
MSTVSLDFNSRPGDTPCMEPSTQRRRMMPTLVAVVAAIAAGYAFHLNWIDVRSRWTRFDTDNNSHAYVVMGLAQNAWNLNPVGWYRDFEGPRTWPPLHGFLGSLIQLANGGPDIRLAVLPSLFGWWLTAVCAALAARRMTPVGGDLAGVFAATFVLASPSHRLFAADVMLESLGAGLTMLCMWTCLRARQLGGVREWTLFGVSLSLLLVEKYNYWVIVAVPVVGIELLAQLREWWKTPGSLATIVAFLHREIRRPLTMLALVVGAIAFGGFALARLQIPVFGKTFRVDGFNNVFEAAALLAMLRIIQWRRECGPGWLAALTDRQRGMFVGFAMPMLVWFCLPKRMGTTIEYLLRKQSSAADYSGWRSGIEYFTRMTVEYYSVHWMFAALVAALIVVAILRSTKLPAGSAVVLLTLGFCVFATTIQPQRSSRFMHSWVALLWVVSGAGFALLTSLIRPQLARRTIAVGALGFLAVVQAPSLAERGHSAEWHQHASLPTTLTVADFYLGEVADDNRVSFVSNVPIGDFAKWTYTERFPKRPRIECFVRKFSEDRERNLKLLEAWTADAELDAIVSIDVDKSSPQYFPSWESYAQFREHLEGQSQFVKTSEKSFPALGCTVSIWRPATRMAIDVVAGLPTVPRR